MKHPTNRRERLYIKKIKDEKDNTGGIRKRAIEERLSHELRELAVLESKEEPVA